MAAEKTLPSTSLERSRNSPNSLAVFYTLLKPDFFSDDQRSLTEDQQVLTVQDALWRNGYIYPSHIKAYRGWEDVRGNQEANMLQIALNGEALATGFLGYFFRSGLKENPQLQDQVVIEMAQAGVRFRENLTHYFPETEGHTDPRNQLLLHAAMHTPDRTWARWDVLTALDSAYRSFLNSLRGQAIQRDQETYAQFRDDTKQRIESANPGTTTDERVTDIQGRSLRQARDIIRRYVGTLNFDTATQEDEVEKLVSGLYLIQEAGWVGSPVFRGAVNYYRHQESIRKQQEAGIIDGTAGERRKRVDAIQALITGLCRENPLKVHSYDTTIFGPGSSAISGRGHSIVGEGSKIGTDKVSMLVGFTGFAENLSGNSLQKVEIVRHERNIGGMIDIGDTVIFDLEKIDKGFDEELPDLSKQESTGIALYASHARVVIKDGGAYVIDPNNEAETRPLSLDELNGLGKELSAVKLIQLPRKAKSVVMGVGETSIPIQILPIKDGSFKPGEPEQLAQVVRQAKEFVNVIHGPVQVTDDRLAEFQTVFDRELAKQGIT